MMARCDSPMNKRKAAIAFLLADAAGASRFHLKLKETKILRSFGTIKNELPHEGHVRFC
jgi:hypothetical protein